MCIIFINLLLQTLALPLSNDDLMNVFGNPIKDFINFLSKHKVKDTNEGLTDSPTMIDVPANVEKCPVGTFRDAYGVCREPW